MKDIDTSKHSLHKREIDLNVTNTFLFLFLFVGLFLGVLAYDFVQNQIGFTYIDEILAFIFLLFTTFIFIHTPNKRIEAYWFWLFGIFLFYILYSFAIHSNTKSAILQDAVVEIKPFLGFFCAYSIGVALTKGQRRIIQVACFIAIFCLLLTTTNVYYFMGHPSRYATAAIFIAMLYLFVSPFTKKNLLVFILMLCVALFSGRSKAFGFIPLVLAFSFFYYNDIRFRFSIKYLLISLGILAIVLIASWQKIDYYFIYGAENISSGEAEYAFARPAMYWGAWQILSDLPFFGSGFASFGTYFSSEHYSDIYYQYNLNIVHGLSEKMPDFIADAYYPSLAQYGLIGIVIFLYFWIYIVRKARSLRTLGHLEYNKYALIVLCVVAFFAIELLADSTLTHNRGFFMMVLMGLSLKKLRMEVV